MTADRTNPWVEFLREMADARAKEYRALWQQVIESETEAANEPANQSDRPA